MGKLTVIGVGPGDYDGMTVRADRALKECQVIVGYHLYGDPMREIVPADIPRACRLMYGAAVLSLLLCRGIKLILIVLV